MKNFSKEEAVILLQPFFLDIHFCISKGFSEYVENFGQFGWKMEIGTKASIIRDFIVDEVKNSFGQNPKISFFEKNGLFLLTVDDLVHIRFKKFTKEFLTSNYPTQQQRSIDYQFETDQMEFPEIPAHLPILNAGYLPNETWTKPEQILISYAFAKSNEWLIELEGGYADVTNTVYLLGNNAEMPKRKPFKLKDIKLRSENEGGIKS